MRTPARTGRGFATVLALWVLALAGLLLAALQWSSLRHAAAGREALALTRARWAARAGLESAIAAIERITQDPSADALAALDAAAEAAEGRLAGAAYVVGYTEGGAFVAGVRDAHARLNINRMTAEAITLLPPYTTADVADAILDWIDADDDVRPLGAEVGSYGVRGGGIEPRNAPIRWIEELELVLGVRAEDVRGEDWNLNGVLDPGEDDGSLSHPPDNADGRLDAGWSAIIGALSADDGLAESGRARLDLAAASAEEVVRRAGVSQAQAEVIVLHARTGSARMGDFLSSSLRQLRDAATGRRGGAVQPLSRQQQAALFAECAINVTGGGIPGRLNVNTCTRKALDHVPGLGPGLADSIYAARQTRPRGFASIVDLLDVPSMSAQRLGALSEWIDVRSNVFEATARGRDERTGIEVEIVATLDRTALPVRIMDFRTR